MKKFKLTFKFILGFGLALVVSESKLLKKVNISFLFLCLVVDFEYDKLYET